MDKAIETTLLSAKHSIQKDTTAKVNCTQETKKDTLNNLQSILQQFTRVLKQKQHIERKPPTNPTMKHRALQHLIEHGHQHSYSKSFNICNEND